MTVAVVIPWRAGCPHREAALHHITDRYRTTYPAWELHLGTCPPGPWCKARAVQAAVDATAAEVLVVADADVWTDGLERALEHLDTWAIPHRALHRLTPDATAAVLAGHELDRKLPTTERPYNGWAGGGIVALRRSTWDAVPLDSRFSGWGHEDSSWSLALRCLIGHEWRGSAPLYHLWHPPQARTQRNVGSAESKALHRRYQLAARHPRRMAALVDEGRPTCALG